LIFLVVLYVSLVIAILAGYLAGYVLILRNASKITIKHDDLDLGKIELPYIDIILPVKNEYFLISDKLQDLITQSYPTSKMNIIIVDSSLDSRIEKCVGKFMREHGLPTVTFIKDLQRRGKAHALNLALEASKHEICVVTDVDVSIEKDALAKLIRNFADNSVGAVSAMETLVQDATVGSQTLKIYRDYYNLLRIAESNMDSVLMCESELAAYRRDLLGKLDEGVQSDDMELTISIRRKGFRAIYDPGARFYEIEGVKWTDRLDRKVRRARANTHCLIKNFDVLFDAKLEKFGTIIFPFEFFSYVVSPILALVAMALFALQVFLFPEPLLIVLITAVLLASVIIAVGNLQQEKDRIRKSDLIRRGILFLMSFVEYNLVLFFALLLVLTKGPQPSWERTERNPISVS